jgi:SagB-type dehydrogenase family enzyme
MSARILLLYDGAERGAVMEGLTSGVQSALARLSGEGASEAELKAHVMETDGATGLPLLYYALDSLAQRGALSYRAAGGGGPLATATSTAAIELPAADPDAEYRLSRFALVRRDGPRMVIETSLSAARITIDDSRVLSLLAALVTPCRILELTSSLSLDEVLALCTLLLGCRMLTDADEEGPLALWSFHDLLFHARSRRGRHHGRWGGTYPYRGVIEPLPVAKPGMSGEIMDLGIPTAPTAVSFDAVLEGRHTSRDFGDPPLTRAQLAEFLYRAARIRSTYDAETGQMLSQRPYPGGGAVYELEIYATVRTCDGLPPGLYHYCPLNHRLARLAEPPETLLRDATQRPHAAPQVLLTLTARFGRIFWKYESMGYALILKDVGALLQTMYVVAEAMGLGACAIGGGDSDLFAAAAGLDYYAETSVGEFVIGSRAEGGSR